VKKDLSKLVYTTDPEEAKRLRESGAFAPATDAPPQSQNIRVTLDRKRRAGKSVTVASGFQLSPATLEKLGGQLKKRCGAGGTAREQEIEIQGDHVETVMAELTRLGYKVKRSGG
jgi:translation initiation factor 1